MKVKANCEECGYPFFRHTIKNGYFVCGNDENDSLLGRLLELAGKLSSHYTQELFSEYNSLRKEIEEKIEKYDDLLKISDIDTSVILSLKSQLEISEKLSNDRLGVMEEYKQENKKLQEELDRINNFVGHITLEELLVELEQYKSVIDEIRELSNNFHELDSSGKIHGLETYHFNNQLKSILKEVEKE